MCWIEIFFSALHNAMFCQFYFTIHDCTKFSKNTPIFGNSLGVASIQERPLLARVRNFSDPDNARKRGTTGLVNAQDQLSFM